MKKDAPLISIVMPIYNLEDYLAESLDSVAGQVYTNYELICVDDGSTDGSVDIVESYAKKDSRISLVRQQNAGAGAARNNGIRRAKGKYILFLDGDDIFSRGLLERTCEVAEYEEADIVAYNYMKFYEDGTRKEFKGYHPNMVKGIEKKMVFNYEDCPDLIMTVINPTPWNKLYRLDFVKENNLWFEEVSSTNDITFAGVSVAKAKRVTFLDDTLVYYRIGHSGTTTSTKTKNLGNVIRAVESAVRQAKEISYYEKIKTAVQHFVIDNYVFSLNHYVPDLTTDIAKEFYEHIHECFNSELFDGLTCDALKNFELWSWFNAIKKNDYESMLKLSEKQIVVSFTTYPARINCVGKIVKNMYNQTRLPDKVMLSLAKEQFPKGEAELPNDVKNYIRDGKLEVYWCDEDIKPHKKYFYAMQKYPEALIVTIDDDLKYNNRMLERLYASYLQFPTCISASRAHLMVVDETGKLMPYKYWPMEVDVHTLEPTMHYLVTGGAGTLYPPHLFGDVLFNLNGINKCLFADDLWMKAAELVYDIPVVLASKREGLKYIAGSQENALWYDNVGEGGNDEQLAGIIKWLDENVSEGIFMERLVNSNVGENLLTITSLSEHFLAYRQRVAKEREAKKGKTIELDHSLDSVAKEEAPKSFKERLRNMLPATLKNVNHALFKSQKQVDKDLRLSRRQLRKTETVLREVKTNGLAIEDISSRLEDISKTLDYLTNKDK